MGENDGLTGTIPTEIGLMTSLEILDLSSTTLLTGTIPTELGLLSNLRSVDLGFSALTGAVPSELCTVSADPSLFLDTLIVDCGASAEVACSVPDCCSSCAE